jgi:NADPH-dependent 2,4-dienoyl-CoA reductase/sulfur reductase-like enzyme
MNVETDLATYEANLINVIPAQISGRIARDCGLANPTGYCAIDPASMKTTVDANVYVIGDGCIAGEMPKSASTANSQAKVAAAMIRNELMGTEPVPARYTTACWSLIETEDAVKVDGKYEPSSGKIVTVESSVSKTGESADVRRNTQAENMAWYAGITADIFS